MPKGRPDKGYALTPQREKVLRILAAEGGSLSDESGLVVSRLRERTGHENTRALSMVIKQLETSGLIKRDVAGRRTYHLELVASALAPDDLDRLGVRNGHRAEPVAVPAPEPSVFFEDDESADTQSSDLTAKSDDGTDYRKLADELLKSALNAISHKAGDPKLKIRIAHLEDRLASEKDRADHLEAQLIERGNELIAAKEALRIAEHNLDATRKAKAKETHDRGSDPIAQRLTDRERRELEDLKRMMQERPGASPR